MTESIFQLASFNQTSFCNHCSRLLLASINKNAGCRQTSGSITFLKLFLCKNVKQNKYYAAENTVKEES